MLCRTNTLTDRGTRVWILILLLISMGQFAWGGAAVTLAWDPNTEPDLAGYKVYYGLVSGSYVWSVDVGNVTSFPLVDLLEQTRYFFAVTAYNTAGHESDFSAELSHFVGGPNQPPIISPIPDQEGRLNTPFLVPFTVADRETPADKLVVGGFSDDPGLLASVSFLGSGSNRTAILAPSYNKIGSASVTVWVSDGSLSNASTFSVTFIAPNTPPAISSIGDAITSEDTPTAALPFTVGDAQTPADNLLLTATSSNPDLLPPSGIVFGGSGENRAVTLRPAPEKSGASLVTIFVTDGSLTNSTTFQLTVNPINDPPTISSLGTQTLHEDSASSVLPFSIGDVETSVASLVVTAHSSNLALIPTANVILGGNGTNRTVQVVPARDRTGSAIITLTVSDGVAIARTSFLVSVTPVNDLPSISSLPAQTIQEDGATGSLPVTIGDAETPASGLMLFASSSNTGLVPTGGIYLGGSGSNRTVQVVPAANQSGTAIITLTVSDGAASSSSTFAVTVNAVNDFPTISDISNQTINEDTASSALPFSVGDVETAAANLVVTASSSNPSLIPTSSIILGGSGTSRTVQVVPAANQSGSATITLVVSDGTASSTRSFLVAVNPINDLPTISAVSSQTLNEDTPSSALPFSIGDAETPDANLVVIASSSNPNVIPETGIILGGSGANRTVQVLPASHQSGTSTITLMVSDGVASSATIFTVTVNAVNDLPTISGISNQTINEDTASSILPFSVGDIETAAASLVVTASSSNPSVIPTAGVILGGSGASRTVQVVPVAEQSGSATITLSVSDGALTSRTSFLVTVTPVNDLPSISSVAAQTINEDSATAHLPVTIGDPETAASGLSLSASSSDPVLVPTSAISLSGSGSNRTVQVVPAPNRFGTATITLLVSDGGLSRYSSFVLTVQPVNDAPSLSAFKDVAIAKNSSAGPIPFVIGDLETSANELSVMGTSSNPYVVPDSEIALGGTSSNRTVTLTPLRARTGTTRISILVSDGTLTRSNSFLLTVGNSSDFAVKPTDAQFLAADRYTNSLIISWGSIAGSSYRVLYSTNAAKPVWYPATSAIKATDVVTSWKDSIANAPSRFYRIEKVQ